MSDHDDLYRRLDKPGRVDRIGHDMAVLCADAAAALRAVTAERDRLYDITSDLHNTLMPVLAERDALRRIVRRFGPPPGGLLLDSDEADALRNAFADQETPDGE